jgi:predicted XRE-type DNA-binding protein
VNAGCPKEPDVNLFRKCDGVSDTAQVQLNGGEMKRQKFDNVWFALEKSDAEAVNLSMRSDLLTFIEKVVEKWDVPQAEAAARLGLTRPRLTDLLRGKISKFSLDALSSIATRAGLSVKLTVKKSYTSKAA